jgi:hypothetical protein
LHLVAVGSYFSGLQFYLVGMVDACVRGRSGPSADLVRVSAVIEVCFPQQPVGMSSRPWPRRPRHYVDSVNVFALADRGPDHPVNVIPKSFYAKTRFFQMRKQLL